MLPGIFVEDLFDDFFGVPYSMIRSAERADYRENSRTEQPAEQSAAHPTNQSANRPAVHPAAMLMKTDVLETETSYELDVDLPGFKKEDVQLQLENGYLTIRASRSYDSDQKDQQGRYIRRERYSGQCSRSFRVGEQIRKEDVSARFEDGILKISLPKQMPRQIPASSNLIEIA